MTGGRTGNLAHTDSGGNGQVLLLLHSIGMDSTMWARQVELLAGRRRVLTIDLPGHGRSTAAPPPYALDDVGNDLLDVMRQLGVDTFEVAGTSIGGFMAMWLAVNVPQSVERLLASNTAARLGTGELWSARIAAVEEGGMASVLDQAMERFFAAGYAERDPKGFARAKQVFLATDPVGYIGCCTVLRDSDQTGVIGAITCPTLVIGCEGDVATPPEKSFEIHRAIPGSRLEIIEDGGHLPNLDNPEEFNRLLLDFFA